MSIWKPRVLNVVPDPSEFLTNNSVKRYPNVDTTYQLQIIQAVDNGQCKTDIAREYGVDPQTITRIYKQKHSIIKKYTQKYKLLQEVSTLNLEQKLLDWFDQEYKSGIAITDHQLKSQALEILKPLSEEFTSLNDWLISFLMRHNISKYTQNELCKDKSREDWIRYLKSLDSKDIYIGGVCALAYSLDFNSFLNGQNIDSYVSLLFIVNTLGTDVRELAVVGKELSGPNFQVKSLPVNYYHCANSQVNYSLLINYLMKWDIELSSKGKDIILVLDVPESLTRSFHFNNIIIISTSGLSYVKVILDKIVECFKYHYRRLQISRTLTFGKDNCTFLDYVQIIANAWYSVPHKFIRSLTLPPEEGSLYYNAKDESEYEHSLSQWCKQYNISLNVEQCPSTLDKYMFCDNKLPCVYPGQLNENMQAVDVLSETNCPSTSGIEAFQAMKRLLSYMQGEHADGSIMKYSKYLENQLEYGALLQMYQINSTNDST